MIHLLGTVNVSTELYGDLSNSLVIEIFYQSGSYKAVTLT